MNGLEKPMPLLIGEMQLLLLHTKAKPIILPLILEIQHLQRLFDSNQSMKMKLLHKTKYLSLGLTKWKVKAVNQTLLGQPSPIGKIAQEEFQTFVVFVEFKNHLCP